MSSDIDLHGFIIKQIMTIEGWIVFKNTM
jgi:hypothetical protein